MTGPIKWLILSLSEGPTYSRVRALGVGIYADNGNKPATSPLYNGWFQSDKLKNIPIQMNTGTSNWELPVFAYDVSNISGTGTGPTLNSGTQYWLSMQQTRSLININTGTAYPTASALP